MQRLELTIRFEGEDADQSELNMYDGGTALFGLARVVNRTVHAYVNRDQPQKRGANPIHANTYLLPAKKGCFESAFQIEFHDSIIEEMGPRLVNRNFVDYFLYCVGSATGVDYVPVTKYVQQLADSDESPFEEIAETLEGPLKQLHRPIMHRSATTATFARASTDLVVLDKETGAYVETSTLDTTIEHLVAHVTRYNILSGYGRAYVDVIGKVLPFRIVEFDANPTAHTGATASMSEKSQRMDGKRTFVCQRVRNANGVTKRLVVSEIRK